MPAIQGAIRPRTLALYFGLLLRCHATSARGRQLRMTNLTVADGMRCSELPPRPMGSTEERPHAYFVVIGPFTNKRAYTGWLYAIVALSNALKLHGSTADVVVLCAQLRGALHALPEEEDLLSRRGIHWRYVTALYGAAGYNLGHFKLWAWQHTEYNRIQLLDADVLPLVGMDRFFGFFGDSFDSDFVGCPGKVSALNAGWFLLRPSCGHFKAMTQLLRKNTAANRRRPWDTTLGWGHALPYWTNFAGKTMNAGWNFFDANGNQGHMFSYFLFDAEDLTLIYKDKVVSYGRGRLERNESLLEQLGTHDPTRAKKLHEEVFEGAYPCPFPQNTKTSAYIHFAGFAKPWTKYDPKNPKFKLWYDALGLSPGISLKRDIFPANSHGRPM